MGLISITSLSAKLLVGLVPSCLPKITPYALEVLYRNFSVKRKSETIPSKFKLHSLHNRPASIMPSSHRPPDMAV